MAESNLSAMHRVMADRYGPCTALRSKRHGLYCDLSWTDYRRAADGAAVGLINRGIKPGERIGILAENCPEWLTADIAILATGAADVPIHAPSAPAQVAYQLRHSGARAVIVSGQAQANKVIEVVDTLPDLEFLVSFAPIDCRGKISSLTWEGLKHSGWREGQFGRGLVAKREAALTRDDLATIIYTSGTTGNPKGVMLTHGKLLSNAEATFESTAFTPGDILLSWLPYSHIYARTVDHYLTVLAGATVCLAESPDTLVLNLAETQPTWMTAVPRFYEKTWASVEALPADARASALQRLFGPRIRRLSSGGAPLPKHLAEGYVAREHALRGYAAAEARRSSASTLRQREPRRSGRRPAGVEIALAPDGEILTRGPHVMKGYWKEPEATNAAIIDGWLHTGDVGAIDADGFLTITDRKKDLIITAGGKNIAPAGLERLLTQDALIDEAVVYGDARPFVSALIVPNLERLQQQLGAPNGPLDRDADFVTDARAYALLKSRVELAMQEISQPERVKEFLILARPFRIEDEELTSTLKIRRRHVIKKYQARLDVLYSGGDPAL